MQNIILIVIMIVCVIIILYSIIKSRPDIIVNFLLRIFIGTTLVYIIDLCIKYSGYSIRVGINPVTILTNGVLGLPGVMLLYMISAYFNFK
ncbi:MAG TPA: transcriptional regulator [Clostridiales bacterium]|nr:transcriptional regulator [Clostridiales bacterium]